LVEFPSELIQERAQVRFGKMNNQSERAIRMGLAVSVLTAWLMMITFAQAAGKAMTDRAWDDCSSNVPDQMITGCTMVLEGGIKESTGNRAVAFYNRGLAYLDKDDYDRAIADLSEAIRLKRDYAEAFNNRGIAYIRKGEYDRAIADLNEAIRLKPDHAKAFLNRGGAYFGKDDYDRAIADLSEAIRLKPDYAKAFQSRSEIFSAKGDTDHWQEDWAKAVELELPR
jgi:tetratricopeptide (TPR) repeat protein